MRLPKLLQAEFLAGREINAGEFAASRGVSRQAVNKAMKLFGPAVWKRRSGDTSIWACSDREAVAGVEFPTMRPPRKRPVPVAAEAPTHWHPLLEAWGLPIRPPVIGLPTHHHIQPMLAEGEEEDR